MTLKMFGGQDLIYSTLVAKPEYKFIIQNATTYKNDEILPDGDFSNKVNHVLNGEVSLYEINVNRPSDALVSSFAYKDTTRYAHRTVSQTDFADDTIFAHGDQINIPYPASASINRIYIPAGPEVNSLVPTVPREEEVYAAPNKKYIRALKNVINSRNQLGQNFTYSDMGTKEVNMICIPGIFYGSRIDPGSIELNYYVEGTIKGQLKDTNKDGVLIQTSGSNLGSIAGCVIYEQGLVVLTGSWDLASPYQDHFFEAANRESSWLSFGTGLPLVGTTLASGSVTDSSYEINFKGTNKIPTLTMFAFAEKGMHNFSTNPSYLTQSIQIPSANKKAFVEPEVKIKNIVHSTYVNFDAPYKDTTYISKVGIYDEDKNLIAVATLANPIKKTPDRDYMIKMRLDF